MPFFYYYGSAMVTGSVLELLIALAISAAVFALFVWVFSIGYKRINQLMNERSSRANYKLTALKAGSPMRALFFKELKTYASTPIYIFNTAFGALLMFILTIAAAFFGGETMAQLLELPVVADMMGPMFAALLSLLAVMSCTTCSSISLEGKAFYLVKAAPVPVWKVFAAKISINLLITAVPAVICAVILYAVLGLSIQALLILLILPVLYSFYISFMGLLMNLLSPKMEFTTPAQVVKQSAATVYAMLAGLAGVAVPVALFLLLKLSVDFLWTYLWLVCGGVLLVDILLAAVLGTVGKKALRGCPRIKYLAGKDSCFPAGKASKKEMTGFGPVISFLLILLQAFFRNCQHHFYAVFLVDPGCTGIIIDGDNVAFRMDLSDFPNHALAADVVGQTAEGLCAHDVGEALLNQFQHFRRQQPALAHLVTVADNPLNQLFSSHCRGGGKKSRGTASQRQ